MRLRRHTSPGLVSAVAGQRLFRDVGLLLALFVLTYGVAFVWLSPTLLVATEHAVPLVIEQTEQEARQHLERLRFRIKVDEYRPHPSIHRGGVVWQDPPAGVALAEGSTVALTVSSGIVQAGVPDVTGLALAQAELVLVAAGFRVGDVDTVAGDGVGAELDVVLTTRPAAGEGRDPGSAVSLVVGSAGPEVGLVSSRETEP